MATLEKCDRWDARFFSLCALLASWSEDERRRVGSVIVGPGNEILGTGYNGLPRRVSPHQTRHSRENDEKYFWFEHAERNAIFNMARSGVSTLGRRMYVDNFPCADCARAIIQSGIVEVNSFPSESADLKYARHYEIAQTLFLEAGVQVRLFGRDDYLLHEAKKRFLTVSDL
ncbi:deoxycytidylate deaminase [Bradyrhizobium sp. SZCCHNS3055]|uniref:deoxycytidylate deaminase n=1 Tax=Bradyrhizobium sp. SZCCHNS3055 TaxID=3057323 RepID=UPI0028EDE8D1|nr:deaminase [Bradyrhizobium sp. SZCCHNS3055]